MWRLSYRLHVKNADFGDVTGVTLGHEGIGKVIEVAEDVESLKLETVCLSLGCSKAVEDVNIVQQVVKHFAVVCEKCWLYSRWCNG